MLTEKCSHINSVNKWNICDRLKTIVIMNTTNNRMKNVYSTLSGSLQILPWAIRHIFWELNRQLPHKKDENHFRASHCKDSSTQRINRIDGKCARLSRDLGNQLNLWRSFRTRCSVPNFGISKSAWFINHLETISKAYVRILDRSTWNQKEYLKENRKHVLNQLLHHHQRISHKHLLVLYRLKKLLNQLSPKFLGNKKVQYWSSMTSKLEWQLTETSNNSGSKKTKKTESHATHHTLRSADTVMN